MARNTLLAKFLGRILTVSDLNHFLTLYFQPGYLIVLVKQPNPQHFAAMYQSNVFINDEGKYTTSDHSKIAMHENSKKNEMTRT